MTLFYNLKALLISLLAVTLLTSCTKEEASSPLGDSLVNVKLTGTQTQLSRFNLEIIDVQFKVLEDDSDPNAWLSLNALNTGVHDLTDFNGNQFITLVDFEHVPSEFIYNIKLVLGDQNTVVKNGIEYVVAMESEYDNSSVNKLEKQLVENKLYEFTIELNIDESVSFSSLNEVKLNPKMNTLMRLYNLF